MAIGETFASMQAEGELRRWRSLSRRVEGIDPLDLFDTGDGKTRVYWRAGELSIAGVGLAKRASLQGPNRLAQARAWMQKHARPEEDDSATIFPPGLPRVLAGFAFDNRPLKSSGWGGFGAGLLLVPAIQLTQIGDERWITVSSPAGEGGSSLSRRWERAVKEIRPRSGRGALPSSYGVQESSKQEWKEAVGLALGRIRAGEVEKVVLARHKDVWSDERLSLAWILERLSARYPDCYTFAFEPTAGQAFWGASPELLCEVREGRVTSMALAGSVGRGKSQGDDRAREEALMSALKEQTEHRLVVDAILDSLHAVADHITAADRPSVRRLANIQHLHTTIEAVLKEGKDILDAVAALHPTPALCGAPREKAAELMRQLEPNPRGWYGGPLGWMDMEGQGSFAVGIRSALTRGKRTRLFAGAGIVEGSVPESEWAETALKMSALEDFLWSPVQ